MWGSGEQLLSAGRGHSPALDITHQSLAVSSLSEYAPNKPNQEDVAPVVVGNEPGSEARAETSGRALPTSSKAQQTLPVRPAARKPACSQLEMRRPSGKSSPRPEFRFKVKSGGQGDLAAPRLEPPASALWQQQEAARLAQGLRNPLLPPQAPGRFQPSALGSEHASGEDASRAESSGSLREGQLLQRPLVEQTLAGAGRGAKHITTGPYESCPCPGIPGGQSNSLSQRLRTHQPGIAQFIGFLPKSVSSGSLRQ